MSLHNDIINIVGNTYTAVTGTWSTQEQQAYNMGHKEARHAAAELATEADKKIEELRAALEAITELYNTDEGCTSLSEYINARKALENTK